MALQFLSDLSDTLPPSQCDRWPSMDCDRYARLALILPRTGPEPRPASTSTSSLNDPDGKDVRSGISRRKPPLLISTRFTFLPSIVALQGVVTGRRGSPRMSGSLLANLLKLRLRICP